MEKKITISPVTRIEGHARVTIHLNDDGKVESAFFHVDQFRGFEKILRRKAFFRNACHHRKNLWYMSHKPSLSFRKSY